MAHAILKDAPPITASHPLTPPARDHAVKTCLPCRDPDERWQSASDLKRLVKWITEAPGVKSHD